MPSFSSFLRSSKAAAVDTEAASGQSKRPVLSPSMPSLSSTVDSRDSVSTQAAPATPRSSVFSSSLSRDSASVKTGTSSLSNDVVPVANEPAEGQDGKKAKRASRGLLKTLISKLVRASLLALISSNSSLSIRVPFSSRPRPSRSVVLLSRPAEPPSRRP